MVSFSAFTLRVNKVFQQMMSYHLNTKRGYSFPAVSSAMQKAVRRGGAKLTTDGSARPVRREEREVSRSCLYQAPRALVGCAWLCAGLA